MSIEKTIEKKILKHVRSKHYRPQKPRQIARQLNFDDERILKNVIKRLVKDGRLLWGPKHLVLRGSNEASESRGDTTRMKGNEVVGVYRRATAGYGFVRPEGMPFKDRSEDVYIPKQKSLDAADGDKVLVRTSRRRQGSEVRISGRVVEVIERRTHQFVGTYSEHAGFGIVVVDNGVFDSGILVGDAGAKNCRLGDKVVIEMANFPSPKQEGEGVIVEVLGERGKPGVDTLLVIREFGLPGEFPEPPLKEARAQAELFDEAIPPTRTDFTSHTVVTIDPKTARDFDDAISLERLSNGHWQLGVHIADVSHFVPYRSELDNEAYARGTSIYLPDRVIPMLPEIISNNLASLQPHRVRYTMSAIMEFTEEGVWVNTELHRGVIKSAHRFSYEEVDQYLADDQPWKKKLSAKVFGLVRDMHTLAMILRSRRMHRGSIDLALPEVRIDLDEDGKVCGAHVEDHTESHQVIEEFMLAANEAVARRLVDEELFLLRRIHENPAEKKLHDLTRFVRMMGIECESLESRFEIKRVIAETAGMPEAAAIQFAILRSMQKAIYSPREIGHYALASDAYCHFTSPIRRYPDLVIHRMVGELIDGRKPISDFDRLESLGAHCSDLERRAEQAERELKKLKLLNFLADRIGMEMEGVVTGVEPYGLFVQGIELPAEGLLPLANLPDDRYLFDRASRTLNGFKRQNQFRLGDRIRVSVSLVDPDQRELEFVMVAPGTKNADRRKRRQPDASEGTSVRDAVKQKTKIEVNLGRTPRLRTHQKEKEEVKIRQQIAEDQEKSDKQKSDEQKAAKAKSQQKSSGETRKEIGES